MNTSYVVVGESTFIFTIGDYKIITDPWFGESIYGGGWTQYPLPKFTLRQLSGITHIFISHIHPDHCCIDSIKKILGYSPRAKLIIMERGKVCHLSKKLSRSFDIALNEWVISLNPYEEIRLDDLSLWCLPPSSDNSLNDLIDSSLLLKCPEGLILFSNDNLPTLEHANFLNNLDIPQYIALIPFSGGSGYPSSYMNIRFEEKLQIASTIRANYEKIAVDFLAATNFKYFMPVAGNHILTSKSYDFHMTTGFLQNPYTAIKNVNSSLVTSTGIYTEPGHDIVSNDAIVSGKTISCKEENFSFQRAHFVDSVSSRMVPDVTMFPSLSDSEIQDAFNKYSQRLQGCIIDISSNYPNESPLLVLTCANVSLTIDQESCIISLSDSSAYEKVVNKHSQHPFLLCIDFTSNLLNAITKKSIHINEADAACLLTYYRTMPYIPELYTSLFTTIH